MKESELRLTRRCLEHLTTAGREVHVQTKSDMILRDLDVLDPDRALIGLTVTTSDPELAARMEPFAPPPDRRIGALAKARRRGFDTICRIDPLVPGVNNAAGPLGELVRRLRDAGVRKVIASTFKKRWDSARRFEAGFPEEAASCSGLYEPGLVQGYMYMKQDVRREMMQRLRAIVHDHDMTFSCCREGFPRLNDGCCDGRMQCEMKD